jgi:hypothetical protein
MSHTIELPDELYRALERYAAQRGQTAEAAILAWATTIQREATAATNHSGAQTSINDPTRDPWAGFRGATTALSPDSLDRHDAYLAEEYTKRHDADK